MRNSVETGEVEGQILCLRREYRREYQKSDMMVMVTWCWHHQVFHICKCVDCVWDYVPSPHLLLCVTGFTFSPGDYREKEDMYDEIIRLKKVKVTKWMLCIQLIHSLFSPPTWIKALFIFCTSWFPYALFICWTFSFILSFLDLWLITSPVLCAEPPGTEDWQPANESQTTPPGGR